MPNLKKGSKGDPVKKLQELINTNGAKPPLKIDGIFGPLTDKAVRKFQKKVNLKADGKAGDLTLASAKYGKPLPEMKVEDYKKLKHSRGSKEIDTGMIIQEFENIGAAIDKLAPVVKKELATAIKLANDSGTFAGSVHQISNEIISRQKKFEDVLLKDPKAAQKLATECEALDKKADKIYEGSYRPAIRKASESTSKIARQIDESLPKINNSVTYLKRKTTE